MIEKQRHSLLHRIILWEILYKVSIFLVDLYVNGLSIGQRQSLFCEKTTHYILWRADLTCRKYCANVIQFSKSWCIILLVERWFFWCLR